MYQWVQWVQVRYSPLSTYDKRVFFVPNWRAFRLSVTSIFRDAYEKGMSSQTLFYHQHINISSRATYSVTHCLRSLVTQTRAKYATHLDLPARENEMQLVTLFTTYFNKSMML